MSPQPGDPISPLIEAMASMHELFLAAVASGFTEAQALQIVIGLAANTQSNS